MRGRLASTILFVLFVPSLAWAQRPPESLAPYVPTPMEVVEEMLKLAGVTKDDVVYDLGCGDGRIVVTAAKKFGARGVGVDINYQRVKESWENVRKNKVEDKVTIILGDATQVDVSEATVVTLYLLREANLKLRPKLLRELKPGARIVSHDFDMGEWKPDKVVHVKDKGGWTHTLYLWVIKPPAAASGVWKWEEIGPSGRATCSAKIKQEGSAFEGVYSGPEGKNLPLESPLLSGDEISFVVTATVNGRRVVKRYEGKIRGDSIYGFVTVKGLPRGGKRRWSAKRQPVRVEGRWRVSLLTPQGERKALLSLVRKGEKISGNLTVGSVAFPLSRAALKGANLEFEVVLPSPVGELPFLFRGFVDGETIEGTVTTKLFKGKLVWRARRR